MSAHYTEEWLADRLARQASKPLQGSKAPQQPKAKSKYRARPTVVDSIRFASKKEAARYQELKLLVKAGEISNLQLQVKFSLDIEGHHICNYICDFAYDAKEGDVIVEDSKGFRTRDYVIKRNLMWALHRIRIKET